ncbi:MAG TPA: zinc-ribbon domain-containing protein [Acidimicrobiia bacterium]|nr:zinc-ribbon domain-containing protein [Acidimicrobiia bacterium]
MQAHCPRCGAELSSDATECPVCAYGDVEEIVLLEAQRPGVPPPATPGPSAVPRVLAAVVFLVVVIVVIFAALD